MTTPRPLDADPAAMTPVQRRALRELAAYVYGSAELMTVDLAFASDDEEAEYLATVRTIGRELIARAAAADAAATAAPGPR